MTAQSPDGRYLVISSHHLQEQGQDVVPAGRYERLRDAIKHCESVTYKMGVMDAQSESRGYIYINWDAPPPSTPWGQIQHKKRLAAGIWSVSTSSHGGIWLSEEYDKIIPYDNESWLQPPRVFMCHQADGCLCRGWLDTHGGDLLGLRLGCAKGEVDPEAAYKAISEGPSVPVFESAAAAAKHGRKAIKRPGRKAREIVARIEKKR